MSAVQAALAWQLYQQKRHGSCTIIISLAAIPADCHASCTSTTSMGAVPAGMSWQLYQQTAMPAVAGRTTMAVV
jgi:hypothetical protein